MKSGESYPMTDAASAEEAEPMDGGMHYSMSEAPPMAPDALPRPGDLAKTDASGADVKPEVSPSPATARRPILIYEAELGIAVFHASENLDRIEKMAADRGGYLVTRYDNSIKVRVPAPVFEKTIDEILTLGDVRRREVRTEDVTAEYTDLEIRIRNAVMVRERLEKLLERADNVKDALKVEEELRRLTDELEVMKGRIKLLRELSSFSTITVEFTERVSQIRSRVELPFPFLQELGLQRLLDL
jgi:hypothetical protein